MKATCVRSAILGFCAILYGIALLTLSGQAADPPDPTKLKESDIWFDGYRFRDGETLSRLHIHYATLGNPHHNKSGEIDNAVLLLHWTGNSSDSLMTPTYMRSLYSSGAPLDSGRYFLIIPDNVGHGHSSKPSDGLKAKFPQYGYGDIVDIQHKLVTETLGIQHLHAILGMSMGGMNAWQWAEAYPDRMDGVMSVVALPVKVSGRNKLWRQIAINDIQSDPEWDNGNYTSPPVGLKRATEVIAMMIDGVPHLQKMIPNQEAAQLFIDGIAKRSGSIDANDLLYSLKSSADYDPEPNLSSITTKVFVIDFDDDEFNPVSLHVLERLMPTVRHGSFVIQAGTENSFGHLTMAHPELWASHVATFMREIDNHER
ncbi:MAG: alpha/beta fold hydrolase [Verrucomicrobia bacterium]|nr:alpha/beta fold hydrolase [Verrucomicrobiota bacterium]